MESCGVAWAVYLRQHAADWVGYALSLLRSLQNGEKIDG
jgi:hypothetical protein